MAWNYAYAPVIPSLYAAIFVEQDTPLEGCIRQNGWECVRGCIQTNMTDESWNDMSRWLTLVGYQFTGRVERHVRRWFSSREVLGA